MEFSRVFRGRFLDTSLFVLLVSPGEVRRLWNSRFFWNHIDTDPNPNPAKVNWDELNHSYYKKEYGGVIKPKVNQLYFFLVVLRIILTLEISTSPIFLKNCTINKRKICTSTFEKLVVFLINLKFDIYSHMEIWVWLATLLTAGVFKMDIPYYRLRLPYIL